MGFPESILTTFVLTYLLHSSVLLGAAWLGSRLLGERRRTREVLWRAAALGSLLTAAVQVGIGFEPLGGRLELAGSAGAERVAQRPASEERAASPARLGAEPVRALPSAAPTPVPHSAGAARRVPRRLELSQPRGAEVVPSLAPAAVQPAHAHPALQPEGAPWTLATLRRRASEGLGASLATLQGRPLLAPLVQAATVLLLALGALGLLRIARGWLVLRRALRARREVLEGPLAEAWSTLLAHANQGRAPRLYICPALTTPLTTGLLRPRICVPERAASELSPAAQRALLAHELAHAQRRDPLWKLALSILSALLWVQPLNRVARRELEALAELACDDRALELGARALELARCLTHVAGWVVAGPRGLPASGMATQSAGLGERVRRLIDGRSGAPAEPRLPLALVCAAAALAGVCAAAPAVVAHPGASPLGIAAPPETSRQAALRSFPARSPLERRAAPAAEAARGLPELLSAVDAELESLAGDLRLLRARAGALREPGRVPARIALIERRLADLRAQRAQLAQLLSLAFAPHGPLGAASDSNSVLPTVPATPPLRGEETR